MVLELQCRFQIFCKFKFVNHIFVSASNPIPAISTRAIIQRARVLGVGSERTATLGAIVLAADVTDEPSHPVAQRQRRRVPCHGQLCLYRKSASR